MPQQLRTRKNGADLTAIERAPAPPPAHDPAEEGIKLGRRIRALRLAAGLTLSELARTTGVSIGTLSQLERGRVSPTVRTLFSVGNALGVAPAWLIDPRPPVADDGTGRFIVRANQRARFLDSGGVRKDIASPPASERLKGFFMVIEPGCGSGAQPYTHEGEEIGFILAGTLELQVDGINHTLNEGDCFAFSSRRPHQFANVGPRPASVFWVNAKG